MDRRAVEKQKKRVTLIAALVNLLLGSGKIVIGFNGHSEALVADGVHSFSDLLSDLLILVAIKFGSRDADAEHPYGHARFETLATVILGVLLLMVAGGIVWDAMERLSLDEHLVPDALVMVMAIISIASNEWLYYYTRLVAKRTRSQLLMANAWHHRSDSVSSVVVVAGVVGTQLGYSFSDSVAAIVVALMVGKTGFSILLGSLQELVDTALPTSQVDQIRTAICSVEGVNAVHSLRTRHMGSEALVDTHILVNPKITVSEGHLIGDAVRSSVMLECEEVADVLVHIDPEDDKCQAENDGLPLRREVVKQVKAYWKWLEVAEKIEKINLHYAQGKVEIEVMLPFSAINESNTVEQIEQQLAGVESELDFISVVRVYYTSRGPRRNNKVCGSERRSGTDSSSEDI